MSPDDKLRLALDMFSVGCDVMREKLRRECAGADDETIERLLQAWLRQRPGAEGGDAIGRSVSWPRNGDGGTR